MKEYNILVMLVFFNIYLLIICLENVTGERSRLELTHRSVVTKNGIGILFKINRTGNILL